MNRACEKWKDALLEAALSGTLAIELSSHLEGCPACCFELKTLEARRAQLDQILPLVAQTAEPSPDFRSRVLARAYAPWRESSSRMWRRWVFAGSTAVAVALFIGLTFIRKRAVTVSKDDLAAAQKLAEWRAPTDSLLSTPGQKFLRSVPTLGKSYLDIRAGKNRED